MHHALIAIHHDMIAIQRLGGDARAMDHQRNGQGPRNNGCVRTDRALFQHDAFQAAAIIQQFGRADIAGNQDGVGGHFGPRFGALAGENAQKPVG